MIHFWDKEDPSNSFKATHAWIFFSTLTHKSLKSRECWSRFCASWTILHLQHAWWTDRIELQLLQKWVLLPVLDVVLHVVLAAKIPRAIAKATHKRNPETAITVNPRSKPDRLFHHVGFLHENRIIYIKWNDTIKSILFLRKIYLYN